MFRYLFIIILLVLITSRLKAQERTSLTGRPVDAVNVFLGTSGDHGQLSPAASSPFNMMSIGPQTKPHIHTGYDYYAKVFEGFTHTRIEGVGCTGSGGNILVKPILGEDLTTELYKKQDYAYPGFYSVSFENGIKAEMSVDTNFGIHKYEFPNEESSLFLDLSYAFADRFVAEKHTLHANVITGYIDTKTTCDVGVYRIYYAIEIRNVSELKPSGNHGLIAVRENKHKPMEVRVGFSSVAEDYALKKIENSSISLETLKEHTITNWNQLLSRVEVKGEKDREALFYSLLYRGLQSPYLISETDGVYRAIDGSRQTSDFPAYNGWAIWDNYREQLPMLSLLYQDTFASIAKSIANLYRYGKQSWATMHEPSPTVRTEHAIVVLLDAYNKGYAVNFEAIQEALITEVEQLDYSAPDKALESSYDTWAMSEILKITGDTSLSENYALKALKYKSYWNTDFADLSKDDVDKMQARGLYQGTIWQYRWFVPFDVDGLKTLIGGEDLFVKQLNQFFADYNYNHANQPDLQVPGLYNATKQPWKSQKLFRNIMLDTVVQTYFNNNSKGVDPYIGKIYNNRPKAYLRTMDDDAGTMSSWFVMRSIGLSPANIGDPIYYLTAPIFKSVKINMGDSKILNIEVKHYNKDHFYIQTVYFNGKKLERNWLTQKELTQGGQLLIETGPKPNKSFGIHNQWISSLKE
ncbi:glycoside hydrolase family 92 protein [Formosa sediminum]|uniref:Glycoside hydrolase family 92 protein n=1 Tax=Formosa sediminum TaxID=2594004 RepID=A0A516GRR7_9FLAO|nr:glycoside hydrolase domain-containing protein [Formosa sediminum]QDO94215.1 glycoside hydrolase family 92 protein [Formosa sediminum]